MSILCRLFGHKLKFVKVYGDMLIICQRCMKFVYVSDILEDAEEPEEIENPAKLEVRDMMFS